MAYQKKTWKDRQTEHPARRKLTKTSTADVYDVTRDEGLIIDEGDPINAVNLNGLEGRIETAFADTATQLGNMATVAVHSKAGTVHSLALGKAATAGIQMVQFAATADYAEGDTWTVDGVAYTAKLQGEEGVLADKYFVAGDMVSVLLDVAGKKLGFKSGGVAVKPPAEWTFLQLITTTGNWVVPQDGWYRVYCVGKSGNGGNGVPATDVSNGNRSSSGAAGGNSGGVAISQLKLKAGQSIAVTVNETLTSFAYHMTATAGGNGGNGVNALTSADKYVLAGGQPSTIVGEAFGGNIVNSTGLQGGAGGISNALYGERSENGKSAGENTGGTIFNLGQNSPGGGGAGNNLQSLGIYKSTENLKGGGTGKTDTLRYTPPFSATPPQTPPLLGGSGGGGAGAQKYSNPNPPLDQGQSGGIGTPGCIIIEKGVN